jgi:N-acetylglucosamine kinase-like BadF-type ATPase
LLLGVDGGATKTVALIADASGTIIGAGRAGSSDIHSQTSPDAAVGEVVASVRSAVAAAAVPMAELDASVFSLCGADWPEDHAFFEARLGEELGLTGRLTVMNDAFGALRAGTSDGVGAVLVMGTGTAVAARGQEGVTWFSGFRMESSGGLDLGQRAYELLIRGEYGPGPEPAFRAAALDVFGVRSVEELVHEVSRRGGLGTRSLARLAPVLLDAGHQGDAMVSSLVAEHGRLLAGYVRAAAVRVSLRGPRATVVTSGGVFRHHGSDLADALRTGLAEFDVRASLAEPAHGALLAAGDRAGIDLDLGRLQDTGPGVAYFATS